MRDLTALEIVMTIIFIGIYLACYYISLQRKQNWAIERQRPVNVQPIVGSPGKDALPSVGPPGPNGRMIHQYAQKTTKGVEQIWKRQLEVRTHLYFVILYIILIGGMSFYLYVGYSHRILSIFLSCFLLSIIFWNWMNGTIPEYFQSIASQLQFIANWFATSGTQAAKVTPEDLVKQLQSKDRNQMETFRKAIAEGYDIILIFNIMRKNLKSELPEDLPEILDPRQVITKKYADLVANKDLPKQVLQEQLQKIVQQYVDDMKPILFRMYKTVSLAVHPDKLPYDTLRDMNVKPTDITNPPMQSCDVSNNPPTCTSRSMSYEKVVVAIFSLIQVGTKKQVQHFYDYVIARMSFDPVPPLHPVVLALLNHSSHRVQQTDA